MRQRGKFPAPETLLSAQIGQRRFNGFDHRRIGVPRHIGFRKPLAFLAIGDLSIRLTVFGLVMGLALVLLAVMVCWLAHQCLVEEPVSPPFRPRTRPNVLLIRALVGRVRRWRAR